jgi:hypothetical protein
VIRFSLRLRILVSMLVTETHQVTNLSKGTLEVVVVLLLGLVN